MIDLNGFGNSELSQENSYSIAEYHKDIACLLENCSEQLPLFLLGYGMGAGVLLSLLIRNPRLNIAGVIITSAMIKCPEQFKTTCLSNMVLNAMGKKEEVFIFLYFFLKKCQNFRKFSYAQRLTLLPFARTIIE